MNKLILLSLVSSLVGLFFIYYASTRITPKLVEIGEINPEMIGSAVAVNGVVSSVRESNGHLFVELEDDGKTISIPIFSDLASGIEKGRIREGAEITVHGYLDEYRGKLQVVPRNSEALKVVD